MKFKRNVVLMLCVLLLVCWWMSWSRFISKSIFLPISLLSKSSWSDEEKRESTKVDDSNSNLRHVLVIQERHDVSEPINQSAAKKSNDSSGKFNLQIHLIPATPTPSQTVEVKQFKVPQVSCVKLFQNDSVEMSKALQYQIDHPKQALSPEFYLSLASDCPRFLSERGYITSHLTEEERDFPIAYSILMYKDIEQFERLLRAIYRPQNYYCVHVDKKSDEKLFQAVRTITNCLENVFTSSRRIDVIHSTYSDVEPEIQCMEDLWKYTKWRYFINLTGQEFPLKTNYEMVRLLRELKGTNIIQGSRKSMWDFRWKYVYWRDGKEVQPQWTVTKAPPPHGIKPTKGSVHIIAQRGFVDFVLHDHVAKNFWDWANDTIFPGETFFSTLNHNPELHVPGSVKDNKLIFNEPRYKVWFDLPYMTCKGFFSRGICIFAVGDLPILASSNEVFANKFYIDYHPLVLDCLDEWHMNKTRDRTMGATSLKIIYTE